MAKTAQSGCCMRGFSHQYKTQAGRYSTLSCATTFCRLHVAIKEHYCITRRSVATLLTMT
eukprot:2156192-Amphidinium_carterae.1